MGSIKEQWLAEQEYKRDKILADILGITHVELDSTQWELKELKNNDGAVTYLLVKFDEASPKEILDKIIEDWKKQSGDEQTDDILIIGFKV